MNRLVLVCLVAVFLFANCQKKEEPKVQSPFPAGTMAMQDKILQLQELVRQNPKNLNALDRTRELPYGFRSFS